MFDQATKRPAGRRAARLVLWAIASAASQVVVVVAFLSLYDPPPAKPRAEPVVDVKFVKGSPVPAAPPPARPAPAPAPRERREAPRPIPAMVQPKDVAPEIAPPDPADRPEAEAVTADGGVVGGVVGGDPDAVPRPPAEPREFDEASMTRPVFVSGPELAYTRRALERDVEGLMIVKCVVTSAGQVRRCQVLKGLPYMDEAVVEALERRRYRPATLGGEPVDVSYVFRINLKLPR
jgi:protein TonB